MITDVGRRIIELRSQGISISKIKEKTGYSKSTISKWCSTLRNNSNIIEENNSNYGMSDEKRLFREKEALRQIKPNDPSWFNDYKSRKRESAKLFLMSPVGYKCQVCGYDKHTGGLSFHHVDSTIKDFNVSSTKLTYSPKRLVEEASKCLLVCHNCHSEIHAGLIDDSKIALISFDGIKIPHSFIEWYSSNIGVFK